MAIWRHPTHVTPLPSPQPRDPPHPASPPAFHQGSTRSAARGADAQHALEAREPFEPFEAYEARHVHAAMTRGEAEQVLTGFGLAAGVALVRRKDDVTYALSVCTATGPDGANPAKFAHHKLEHRYRSGQKRVHCVCVCYWSASGGAAVRQPL